MAGPFRARVPLAAPFRGLPEPQTDADALPARAMRPGDGPSGIPARIPGLAIGAEAPRAANHQRSHRSDAVSGMGQPKVRHRRTQATLEAQRMAAVLGSEIRSTRRRRRRTQAQLAAAIGISRSRYAELEQGAGATAPLDAWVRVGLALGRPLAVALSRDLDAGPSDAGHLAAQDLVLRLAGGAGRRTGSFELPTRTNDPGRSADVCLRDDARRTLIVVEIWNRLGDVGAAARSPRGSAPISMRWRSWPAATPARTARRSAGC